MKLRCSPPQEDDGASVTATVGPLGTPAWSAPEVLNPKPLTLNANPKS